MQSENPDEADVNELKDIRLSLITSNKPQNFRPNDPDNATISFEKGFAVLASIIEQNGGFNPGAMSCFDFYSRIDYIQSKAPTKKK